MEILIYAGQLILGLSILVALHEFGRFLPAKLFGMRVEGTPSSFRRTLRLRRKRRSATPFTASAACLLVAM